MSQSLWCRVGIHRWTLYGKPQGDNSYTACRRCGKRRSPWGPPTGGRFAPGPNAATTYRWGMGNDQTKKKSKRV